ncbi:MAG: hypothetical protein OXG26_05390, partial [Caldilineaceae bacterium]|nr:hypothetical protein [Caldilineaceae bacterium]
DKMAWDSVWLRRINQSHLTYASPQFGYTFHSDLLLRNRSRRPILHEAVFSSSPAAKTTPDFSYTRMCGGFVIHV